MAILRLFADSKSGARCKSCQRPIVWATMVSGRKMPFDRIIPVDAIEVGGRLIEEVDSTISVSHFATCPHAAEHRRP